jgi:hypothetical protein
LATQQRPILDEIALMRGDIKVLTAIGLRHEETLARVLEQITAMVGQNARIVDRLRTLEERASRLEEQEQ